MSRPPERGGAYERQACDYLIGQGLRLCERNYRCRAGEIDLVMREGDTLVFVEVRYRRDARYGGAAASVTAGKRKRLTAAALHYLQAHASDRPARFDVIAMGAEGAIDWIRDAFAAQDH